MDASVEPVDECPHCQRPFEIVHVKIRLMSVAMISACPNCAMALSQKLQRTAASLFKRLMLRLRAASGKRVR
jgi:hypothetical protein